jgi:hypothetical protein
VVHVQGWVGIGCRACSENFPEADVFSVINFLQGDDAQFLEGRKVRTTFIQGLPFAGKNSAPICR